MTDPPRNPLAMPPSGRARCTTTVVLMRHGLTDWNCEGRVQGGLDHSRLTSVGMRQARLAGVSLRHIPFSGVYVSPLTRARATLDLARQSSANPSLLRARPETLQSLLEIQVPWQGQLKGSIENSFCGDAYARYLADPPGFFFNGFSPVGDLMRRARSSWETISRRGGRCSLIIGHNQLNRALLCDALRLEADLSLFRQVNCCFNVVVLEPGRSARIRLVNATGASTPTTHFTPRWGHVRCVLVCDGGARGITTVLPPGEARQQVKRILMLDDAPGTSLAALGLLNAAMTRLRLREVMDEAGDAGVLEKCNEIVAQVRQAPDSTVVICAEEGGLLSALLTVLIGMGGKGMDTFIFDSGGVTVVDIEADGGRGKKYVECHNFGAFAKESGPVFGYTRNESLFPPFVKRARV